MGFPSKALFLPLLLSRMLLLYPYMMARRVTLVLLLNKCTAQQLYPCPFTISVTLSTSSQGISDWNLIGRMAGDAHCLPHQLFSSSVIFLG